MTKPHPLLPVFSLLLTATLWGVFWYPLRLLEQQGLHGLWSSLLLYSGTLVVAIPLMRGRWHELARAPWRLLFIGLASGVCNISFILAILDGNVVRVLLLFYLSPLWATLMGWLFLGERLSGRTVTVLVVALSGAGIMLWQPGMALPWPRATADWLALLSGFSFALLNVVLRHLQAVSVYTKTAAGWVGVIGVAVVLLLLSGQSLAPASTAAIMAAPLTGMVILVIMTLSVVYGVTHMPVQRSAIILLFEIVAGAVSAQLLTDEVIRPREWLGGALVILAAYLSARVRH
ncbi:MAG TPA: DMT family transporter [Chromatiales bacterium]|nr:DMT family transporter [Chromatiales bacterium]